MCRNWASGPYLGIDCGVGNIEINGEENITRFDSSEWGERGFCSKCGTHLFYRLKEKDQYIVSIGIFELNEKDINFHHQIFIEEKPSYYDFSNDTKKMTGEEVFAAFSS